MSDMLTCLCPNCGSKLVYGKGDKTVTCFACDSSMSIEELTGNSGASMAASAGMSTSFGGAMAPAMAMIGFDNPESGVVFIENFFETYNWVAYAVSSEIAIPEIAEVIANNKMKNGASPLSWYLDYKGLAYPLRKKIEGLDVHQKLIGEKYDPIDPSEAYTAFDSYRRICKALTAEKAAIFKQLDTAVKYAEKFALDSGKLAEIKNDLADLKGLFDKHVKVIKEITDIPAYAEAKAAANKEKAMELARLGIDAEATYQKALGLYNSTDPNKSSALKLFESIRGYNDSVEYIDKINQYFNFDDKMYRFFGKHFIYKEEDYSPTLDLKKLGKKALKKAKAEGEDDSAKDTKALSLYEVVDGVPAEEALIKGIDKIIDCYGSRFYYFKLNEGIYCFDIYKKEETIVDTGKTDDYKNAESNYEFGYSKSGSSFYVKKKVPAAAALKGCMSNLKKKKATEDPVLNPYCVILVDMATNSCRTVISQFLEIAQHHEDKLFYKFAYKPEKAKSGCLKPQVEPETKTRLMVCDVAKGTSRQVLDEDCEIHTVHKDYIVYSLWKPNRFNRDLHVYDLENSTDTLIEPNIFNFFDIIDNRLYYTVGNEDYCPLVRSDFNGENREEIMANVENIVGERGGWMYVKKGRGRNSVLVKVSSDGKHRQLLCTQFKSLCRFEDSYVYYVDTYNTLRVVRIDGKESRKLAENVTKVFPSDNGLFYCRDEQVGESRHDTALSLYKMDKEGRNVRKIVFNVDCVQNDPKTNTLYYSKAENMRFKEYEVGKEDKAIYAFHDIEKFFRMDKDTGVSELVLTLGLPQAPETGCLKKKKKQMVYQEAPIRQSYASKGLVADDEETDDTIVEDQPALPSFLPAGCASILNAGKSLTKGKSGSTPKVASANKGKSSKNAKLNLPKFSPISLLIGFVILALLGGSFSFLSIRIDSYGYPEIIEIILPIVLGLVAAALGLILIGIIPLSIGGLKKNRGLGGIALVTALIYLVSGVWGIIALPGKGDTPGKAIEVTLNESETVKLAEYTEQYYEFTPSKTGLYNISVENNSASSDIQCYVYTDYSDEYTGSYLYNLKLDGDGHSSSSNESSVQAVELTANTTYLLKWTYYYSYTDGEFDFKVTEHPRLNATALTIGEAVTVSLPEGSSEAWFSFVYDDGIPGSTNYYSFEFTHDADCNINSNLYKGSKETTDYYSSNNQWKYTSFENGVTYYVSLTSDSSFGDSEFTFIVDWPEDGTSSKTAFTATAGSSIKKDISSESSLWYKYKAERSGLSTIKADAGTKTITLNVYTADQLNSLAKAGTITDTSADPSVSVEMTEGETYYIELVNDNYSTAYDVTLTVGIPENGEDVESAITAYEENSYTGSVSSTKNSVWYKFNASTSGNYVITLTADESVELYLYDEDPENGAGPDLELDGTEIEETFYASSSSTYYCEVRYFADDADFTVSIARERDGNSWQTAYIANANTPYTKTMNSSSNVWYEYEATMDGYYTITTTQDNTVYLYSYTNPTSSYYDYDYSSSSNELTWELETGEIVYFKVYASYSDSDTTYTFTINLPQTGETPDTAYVAELFTSSSKYVDSGEDMWIRFTPEKDGKYYLSASTSYTNISVYGYEDPTSSTADISSTSDDSHMVEVELTAGTPYYFKVTSNGSTSVSFKIVPQGTTYTTAYEATYDTDYEGSVSYSEDSVWYKYTAVVGGEHTITTTSDSTVYLYAYTESGASNSSYSYYDYDTSNSISWSLTADTTYYFKVGYYYSYNNGEMDFTFNIALPEDGTSALTAYKAVPDTKKTGSLYNNEVWYKYTAVVDGEHTIETTSYDSIDVELYNAVDGSAIDSENGTATEMTYTMEEGKTYYFKMSYDSYSTNDYTFKITAPQDGTSAVTAFVLELDGDTLTGTVDDTTTEVWYKFTPEHTYYYTFNVTEPNYNYVYLYKYDSATATSYSDYTSSYNISYSGWYLTAGTTYYFKIAQRYSGDTCNYSINVSSYEDGNYYYSAYNVKGQTSNGSSSWSTSVSVNSGYSKWYKVTAHAEGTYTFSLSASSSTYYRKYFKGYSDPTGSYDGGSSSYVTSTSFSKTLEKGDTYYIQITGYNSYGYSSTFNVSGPGLSYDNAISLSYETEQEITVPKGGYVWLKYTPDYYNSGSTHYVKVSGAGYTTTYVYEGTSTYYYNNASGNSYTVDYTMSDSYTYYIRVYSEYGATVKVSVSTSSN